MANKNNINRDYIDNYAVKEFATNELADKYFEDIDLSKEEFYEKQIAGSDIHTSQPSPASICDMWDELLKEYEAGSSFLTYKPG